jgi:uncharacterized protein
MMTGFATDLITLSPLLWTLVSFQLVMGAFDVLYHHELTERLAWKANAAKELKLHAARNVFYAGLFAAFAWLQPGGLWAWLLLMVLVAEIGITLADFVEEDMTRKLPATERVLHTLLAINYGGILTLIGPEILAWAARPGGFETVSYGYGSWVLTFASFGCMLFAVRDMATSARASRMAAPKPVPLSDILPSDVINGRKSVLITGGTGFIGSALVQALAAAGHDVTVLVRSLDRASQLSPPVRVITSFDQLTVTSYFDAIVDLAGEPVAGGLWTRWRMFHVYASRLRMLRDIEKLVARQFFKPTVLIKASAIGRYGLRGDDILTEADTGGDKKLFTVRSCKAVEDATMKAGRTLGVRAVSLRIGLVLGRDGGLLARLLPVFDLGLGGRLGHGQQWMSWISLDDMVRMIAFVIANPDVSGVINATAPNPVRNQEFVTALATTLNRPVRLATPGFALELAFGDFARELVLGSQRVMPVKAEASGFRFLHRSLPEALSAQIGLVPVSPQAASKAREINRPPELCLDP